MKRARPLFTLLAWLFSASLALAATLLPPGEQQFFDLTGRPLSGGSVEFFIPNTTTHKATWSNSTGTSPNANPVPLNTGGFAIIYGSGTYRMLVKDALGNTIYDQLTADTSTAGGLSFGGTSTGTANAQIVTAAGFTLTDGQVVNFRAGFTNSTSTTINANAQGPLTVVKDTTAGPQPLTGGELVSGNAVSLIYDAVLGEFHIINGLAGYFGPNTNIVGAGTTSIGTAPANIVTISGSGATITSFGVAGSLLSPIYMVTFAGANTIVNAGNLITPNGNNLTIAGGDFIIAENLGSGNWKILQYTPASQAVSITPLTSGSGTFNATSFKTLKVTLLGGAGGGGAAATNAGAAGGTTTFGTFTAGGGTGGGAGNTGGVAGDGGAGGAGGSGSCTLRLTGTPGMGGVTNFSSAGIGSPPNLGGNGGASPFGSPGAASTQNTHLTAQANSGSGGAGAAAIGPSTGGSAGGGGSGEYVRDCLIPVAAPTYSWTVGAGGAGGAAGTTAGGAGGSGLILVEGFR